MDVSECPVADLLASLFQLQSQRCLTYQRLADAQTIFFETRNLPAFQNFLGDITVIFARISEEILQIKKRFETNKLVVKHIELLQDYEQKKLQWTNECFLALIAKQTERVDDLRQKLIDLVDHINEVLEELRYDQEEMCPQATSVVGQK
jgi:hypothetical protein